MSTLFALLIPLAGCAVMMVLCARMMRRGNCRAAGPTEAVELDQLRVEVAELRARVASNHAPDRDQHPVR